MDERIDACLKRLIEGQEKAVRTQVEHCGLMLARAAEVTGGDCMCDSLAMAAMKDLAESELLLESIRDFSRCGLLVSENQDDNDEDGSGSSIRA